MGKMTTISAKVAVKEKMRFQQMAKSKKVTVSDLIKQAIKIQNVFDSNEMDKLEEMNRICNEIHYIRENRETHGVIDERILLELIRIEHASKNF